MKTFVKLAVGAAIAGALVNMLRKRWTGNRQENPRDQTETITSEGSGFTIAELAGLDQAQVGSATPTATPP